MQNILIKDNAKMFSVIIIINVFDIWCFFRVIFVNNFAFGPQTDHQVTAFVDHHG